MKKGFIRKVVASIAAATMALTASISALAASSYPDVDPAKHFVDAIEKWSGEKYGVLTGVKGSDGVMVFEPDRAMSLQELATVLVRTFGYTEVAAEVKGSDGLWAEGKLNIQKAIAVGVLSPTLDPVAKPATELTRAAALRIIAKAFQVEPVAGKTPFTDDASIPAASKGYINALVKLGYISEKGYGDGTGNFYPNKLFPRAQVMKVLDNILADITDTSVAGGVASGSLIVRTAGVTITNKVVEGDLIIAPGVGDGDVTLNNVTVKGRLLVLGGGSNTIKAKGCNIPTVNFAKVGGQPAHFDNDSKILSNVSFGNGTTGIVSGKLGIVAVNEGAKVELKNATVTTVVAQGKSATITASAGTTIAKLSVEAADATVAVEKGATVDELVATVNLDHFTVAEGAVVTTTTVAEGVDIDMTAVAEGATVGPVGKPLPPEPVDPGSNGTGNTGNTDNGSSGGVTGPTYSWNVLATSEYVAAVDTIGPLSFIVVKINAGSPAAASVRFTLGGVDYSVHAFNGEYRLALNGRFTVGDLAVKVYR